ncbi:hypothetical protein D3C81_955450 [compost metagenome]
MAHFCRMVADGTRTKLTTGSTTIKILWPYWIGNSRTIPMTMQPIYRLGWRYSCLKVFPGIPKVPIISIWTSTRIINQRWMNITTIRARSEQHWILERALRIRISKRYTPIYLLTSTMIARLGHTISKLRPDIALKKVSIPTSRASDRILSTIR